MHARAIIVRAPRDKIDSALDSLGRVIGELKTKKGMRDAYMAVDRTAGEIMTFTVWDSEEDLQASLQFARDTFGQVRDMLEGEPTIRMLEVTAHESGVRV